jgi:phosphatidate cytidylyltransferase
MQRLIVIVLGCFLVGGILMAVASARAAPSVRHARWVKYFVYLAIVFAVLACARLGTKWLIGLVAVILVLGANEIAAALRRMPRGQGAPSLVIWLCYGALAAACMATLAQLASTDAAFIYVVVASFDGFSQAGGQIVGRHPLAPRISPGKTIEGALAGAIAALCIALALRTMLGQSVAGALQTGLILCASALGGDLSASWLKRRAGIKDFGRVLPGHGGVLDRFDSFLPALALGGTWILHLAR